MNELRELAERLGIEVRIEPLRLPNLGGRGSPQGGKGGLCRIAKRLVILIDSSLSPLEQTGVLGEALGRALRDFGPTVPRVPVAPSLEPYLRTGHGEVGKLVRPRPLARGRPR